MPPLAPSTAVQKQDIIRIGILVPLSSPGWVEAGQHLFAGIKLGVSDVNRAGGISGRHVELLVRDTAANPEIAVAAVDELFGLGVSALAGEYHSVVARAAAHRADELGLPFLCSSAVLDGLTDKMSNWVARLSPPQSRGWQFYADYLLAAGHKYITVAAQPSVYWNAGTRILRDHLAPRGGSVFELDVQSKNPAALCDQLADNGSTALLLLVGFPEPAIAIVKSVRRDRRLANVLIGAPAGQPEFREWEKRLGTDGRAIPFLRYLPERLGPLGQQVETRLFEKLRARPSFVAYEGYDTLVVLAEALRHERKKQVGGSDFWLNVSVEGSRGRIRMCRVPGSPVFEWSGAPIQISVC